MPTHLEEDRRPYPGRHRAPEQQPAPVPAPSWANEHARPVPDLFPPLVGEAPTKLIVYPRPAAGSLPMPLPARAEGAALEAETRYLTPPQVKARRLVRVLGPALQALRFRGRS